MGEAKAAGYYVAAVYREKASGARADAEASPAHHGVAFALEVHTATDPSLVHPRLGLPPGELRSSLHGACERMRHPPMQLGLEVRTADAPATPAAPIPFSPWRTAETPDPEDELAFIATLESGLALEGGGAGEAGPALSVSGVSAGVRSMSQAIAYGLLGGRGK